MTHIIPTVSQGFSGDYRLYRLAKIAALMAAALVSSCAPRGDGAGDSPIGSSPQALSSLNSGDTGALLPRSCDTNDMKSWVYENMNDYYLFYDQVEQNVSLNDFDNEESLISHLRVQPFDNFSYITEEAGYTARFDEGETFGFGWRLHRNEQNEFFFKLVEPNSPLANAGVQRGDQLLAINGILMIDFLQLSNAAVDTALGIEDERVTVAFTIGKPVGAPVDVTVTKSSYPLDTVLETQIISHNNAQVGYLHFYQFLDTSAAELQTAFTEFSAANVSEMVLDLRYNGGGRVFIANELASYLVGNGKTDQPFVTYRPNDKYAENAASLNFTNQAQALNLNRVFVLQSADTCSASELVVNGLRPFMDVITVGSSSCGKPYASIPQATCGKVMNALELEGINANGVGGYYNGITADCPVTENISQALGNPAEALLKTALDFTTLGSCNTIAARSTGQQNLPLPTQLQAPGFPGSTF